MIQKVKNIFLTGVIRIGKTTILNNILNDPLFNNLTIGGYRTKGIVENGIIQGYRLEIIGGGIYNFAHVKLQNSTKKFDRYFVNPDVFDELGANALTDAISLTDVLVIDEIGVIEKEASMFISALKNCLDSSKIVVGIFQFRAHWFMNMIARRQDTLIYEISKTNRNNIHKAIISQLKKNL